MADDDANLRVLLAEDEAMVAALLKDQLKELGCTIVGPAARVAQAATALANGAIDAAIIDLNLHGEIAFGLVRQLERRGVPVLIVSAYDSGYVRKELPDTPYLEKPFGGDEFIAAVERLLKRAAERRQAQFDRKKALTSD